MALFDPQNLAAFATLAVLEIVLGIDNLVFISVTAARLPKERQHRARQVGLALALFTRLALLAGIAWIAQLTTFHSEIPPCRCNRRSSRNRIPPPQERGTCWYLATASVSGFLSGRHR